MDTPPPLPLAEALRQLDAVEEFRGVFPDPWLDESFAAGEPVLEPAEIRAQGEWCGLPPDAIRDASAAADRIAASPAAVTLTRALFRRIFLAPGEYAHRSSAMERFMGDLADAVTLRFRVPCETFDQLNAQVVDASCGKCSCRKTGEGFAQIDA